MSRWRRQQRKRARRAREWAASVDKWLAESEKLFEDIRRDLRLLSLAERVRGLTARDDDPETQRMVSRVLSELLGAGRSETPRPKARFDAAQSTLTVVATEQPLRPGVVVTVAKPSSSSGTVPWR